MRAGEHEAEYAEYEGRKQRVRSVACPKCGAPAGLACTYPKAPRDSTRISHAARWDAWYAAHPEAVS